MMLPIFKLSLVVPVFNERESLDELLGQLLSLQTSLAKELEIILVDDGSTDGSADWIRQKSLKYPQIKPVFHPHNKGIGEALLSGYAQATGEWIANLPSDLQFHPEDLNLGKPYLDQADIISFYRPKRPDYSRYRLWVSQINRSLNQFLFGLSVRDINWVKIYKAWVIQKVSVKSRTPFVESERLIRAHRQGACLVEVEAPYYNRLAGQARGARLRTVLRSGKDLMTFLVKN